MMGKKKDVVFKRLMSAKLCPSGKRIMQESIRSGKGPKAFEPHMQVCAICKKGIDALIDQLAKDLFTK